MWKTPRDIILFTHMHHKLRSYDVWFMRYKVQKTKFFVIMGHFLPFDLRSNQENENFEKIKKPPGDIIILHLCTTNDDHIMYGSWDIKRDKHNFLSFWAIFLAFYPHNNQKIKFQKKERKKTSGDIIILHLHTINYN